MINLRDVCYKYPKKQTFSLSDVSFELRPGEIFTLLGPNGAGKTTIIRILSGLILPQGGSVEICGQDLQLCEYSARAKVGLVLGDERTFYFRLSGAQNLEFFGGLYGLRRRKVKKRVAEVLEQVGLVNDAGLQFMRYSSGMKKRLNIARALLHDPEVLLLDEPNSGVDPESARKIREIILKLKSRGRTILLTTHDMDEAERLSDRIGFLRDGKLLKIGTVNEFKKMVQKRTFTVEFRKDAPLSDSDARKLIEQIGEITSFDSARFEERRLIIEYNGSFDLDRTVGVILHNRIGVESFNTQDASLEDVFIALSR